MRSRAKQTSGHLLPTTSFLNIPMAFTGIFRREFTMPGPLIQIGAGVEWQIPVLPLTAREECSHCPKQQQ